MNSTNGFIMDLNSFGITVGNKTFQVQGERVWYQYQGFLIPYEMDDWMRELITI